MTIKFIFNGYFRSGTTFLWKHLQENLPEYAIFYEPLHPHLFQQIFLEEKYHQKNFLHNAYLMQEYIALPKEIRKKIFQKHPNLSYKGIESEKKLKSYLDIYHNLPYPVALQPNRMHFFLDFVAKTYSAKIVHIIRNPLAVYASMEQTYYKKSQIPKFILYLIYPYWFQKRTWFYIDKDYKWILRKGLLPYIPQKIFFKRLQSREEAFEKFVVVWTLSNYYALQAIEKNKGLLIIYEELLQNPHKVLKELYNYLGFSEKKELVVTGNISKFSQKQVQQFARVIDLYKLQKELGFILSKVNKKKRFYSL